MQHAQSDSGMCWSHAHDRVLCLAVAVVVQSYMLAAESAFWLRDFRLNPLAGVGQPSWFLIYLPDLDNLVTEDDSSDLYNALLVAWAHDPVRVAEIDAMDNATLAELIQWVLARVRDHNERVYLIMDQYNSLTVGPPNESKVDAKERTKLRKQVDSFTKKLRARGCIVLLASSANNSSEWIKEHKLTAQQRTLITLFGGFSQVSITLSSASAAASLVHVNCIATRSLRVLVILRCCAG